MLIFVGLLYYFCYVLTVRNVERYPVRNGFWQTYDAEEDNSIDALFVGDSSIFHSINPMQIWKDKKITTYNLSYAVMKPQEAYFDLKELSRLSHLRQYLLKVSLWWKPKVIALTILLMIQRKLQVL